MLAAMPRLLLAIPLLLLAATARASCVTGGQTAAFAAPGTWAVGVRTLALVDETRATPAHGAYPVEPRRRLTTEVWYPVVGPAGGAPVRDAPAAFGRFPLVVNSHGFLDSRAGEAYLAEQLASRGLVVAAPDFPLTSGATPPPLHAPDIVNQPGDVSFVIDTMLALDRTPGSWLAGRVRRNRIGVSGFSYGGLTTLLVAYHPTLRDRRIRAAMALAPASCVLSQAMFDHARPRLLLVSGDEDALTPLDFNAARAFARSHSSRTLVSLRHGTHTAMTGFITFPSATSYDEIGCGAINSVLATSDFANAFAGFAPELIDVAGCGLPCTNGPLPAPPMQAARQHELTRAAAAAFFEATLKGSSQGQCLLGRALAAENPDVEVAFRRREPLPR
jgi:predicted dienelactone hydrolase